MSEILIFNADVIVFNKISILIIHNAPFNVAERAFEDTDDTR